MYNRKLKQKIQELQKSKEIAESLDICLRMIKKIQNDNRRSISKDAKHIQGIPQKAT